MPKKTKADSSKTSKKVEPKTYHLEISINDSIHQEDTNSFHDSLKAFAFPDIIKTKTVFRYSKGTIQREKVMDVFNARRVFHNPTAMTLLADTMSDELNGR